jgi:hypothetical protein
MGIGRKWLNMARAGAASGFYWWNFAATNGNGRIKSGRYIM